MTLSFTSIANGNATDRPVNHFTKVRGWVVDALLKADCALGRGDVLEDVDHAHPGVCCAVTRAAIESLVADGSLWAEGYMVGLVSE